MYSGPRSNTRPAMLMSSQGEWSIGLETALINSTAGIAHVSTAWPTIRLITYVPLYIPANCLAVKMFCYNGATVSGNVDIGLYDFAGNRLVNSGSTAQAGTTQLQEFNITDTILAGPAVYYMALSLDNTTGTIFAETAQNVGDQRVTGILAEAPGSFGLPATSTPTGFGSTAFIPVFGVALRTLVA